MKKQRILFSIFLLTLIHNSALAQLPPIVSGQPSSNNVNTLSKSSWYRGGNLGPTSTVTPQGNQNVFGTLWNSPIYTFTNSVNRMKINGDGTNYNGVNTSGYIGIGANPNDIRSRLTITGANNTPFAGEGYRNWMKTGVFNLENSDNLYIGMKSEGINRSDAVLAFGDDANGLPNPRNNFRILFTQNEPGPIGANAGHLEIARYTATGNIGFGPVFGDNIGVVPQSLLHMNRGGSQPTFLQISNQFGTGQLATDGLRLGVQNYFGGQTGFLRWQENTPFIVQSDWNATAGGVQNGERMRITSISSVGVPQPATVLDGNITRVAISHKGDNPITAPRSLLHLGYNTGNTSLFNIPDGWRNWMDIGTFTSNGTDHTYVGLKNEGTDQYDAIFNWGDNQVAGTSPNGPDNLRFIFTSTNTALTGQGDPISQSNDGLEVARMHPGLASTLPNTNFGMVGIGNYAANGPNTAAADVIDAKLDIDGDLRIREVTQDNNLTQFLVIDPNDKNRVHYADLTLPQGNGFTDCADNTGAANLLTDSKVNLNNNNLFFENNDLLNTNHTGFGYTCGTVLPAKLSVFQDHSVPTTARTEAISGINNDITTTLLNEQVGVYGQSTQTQNVAIRPMNIAGDFSAGNAEWNIGVRSIVTSPAQNGTETNMGIYTVVNDVDAVTNIGGSFQGGGNANNAGVWGNAIGDLTSPNGLSYGVIGHGRFSLLQNVGVIGRTESIITGTPGNINSPYGAQQNFGIAGYAGGANINIGVYGESSTVGGASNYAGYFTGNTVVLGAILIASDSTLKENIEPISNNTDSLFMLIEPKQYEFMTTGNAERMALPEGTRYGVLAQQVEPLFPELIKVVTHPAEIDSVGNIVNPSFEFKAVDLEQMIPLLIQNSKKQSEKVSALENQLAAQQLANDDLNNRLTQLENCLSNLLPELCQANAMLVESTPSEIQNELRSIINIELSNDNNIVLNQNVPNPFAERTVITYSIPETVGKAQIHFYDGTGKLINTVDISERGNGQINVYANDLSRGVYTYSLVADGQIIATKRMVKQ